jgi:hypothetical protein
MNLNGKVARTGLYLTLCLLSAFGALWRSTAIQAQDYPPSQVELRADSQPQIGQPYVVDVYATIAAPAYGFGVQLSYDANVLQLDLGTDADGTAVPLSLNGLFNGAQRIRNSQAVDGNIATVDAVYTFLPPAEAVAGEGFIGRLSFTVLQAVETQVTLVSPRLIALNNGAALDLPVSESSALMVAPTIVEAAAVAPAAPAEAIVQPVTPPQAVVIETQPLVQSEPIAESIINQLETPGSVLAEINRTNTMINTVAIALLSLMAIILGGVTISNLLEAISGARQPQPVPARAYSYADRIPSPRPQPARPSAARTPRTPSEPREAATPLEDNTPTVPSRSQLEGIKDALKRRKRNS